MTQEFMDKAEKALASARILLKAGDSDGATNRSYCAMFDAAIASISSERDCSSRNWGARSIACKSSG